MNQNNTLNKEFIRLKQKDYAAAEKALRPAVAIDADHYAANLNLRMLYQRAGDKHTIRKYGVISSGRCK